MRSSDALDTFRKAGRASDMGAWNLESVADRLQQAALDPTQWSDALYHLSQTVDGAGALLFSTEKRLPGLPASPDLAESLADYFKDGWNERDQRYRGVPSMLRKGIMDDRDCISREEMARSGFYQDFLGRHGLRWFAGLGFRLGDDLWCVSIQRTISQGPYEPEELRRLSMLLRPLSDAVSLSQKFGFARVLGLTDALELLGQPGMVLDERGRLLALNGLAEDRVSHMIDVRTRSLKFADQKSLAALQSIVAGATAGDLKAAPTTVVSVLDPSGHRRIIRAIGLRGWARFAFTGARVLLIFEDQPKEVPDAASLLRSTFDLTSAETKLAVELAAGASLALAADRMSVTYQTARSSLKAIFSKTETHRQGELIAKLAKFGCIAPDPP